MKSVEKKDDKLIVRFDGPDFRSGLSFCKSQKMRFNKETKDWYTTNLNLYSVFVNAGYVDINKAIPKEETYIPIGIEYTDYKKTKLINKLIPEEMREYQEDALRFMLTTPRTIMDLPPGAGKTLIAAVYQAHIQHNKPYSIILCPASLKIHWQRELLRWAGIHAEIINGMVPYDINPLMNVLIMNYDILGQRDPNYIKNYKETCKRITASNAANGTNTPLPKNNVPIIGWANYLQDKVGVIICDESHMLGETSSIRVKQFVKLCRKVKYIQFLSGTPIRNRPKTFWTQINTCDARTFPSIRAYMTRYCGPSAGWGGIEYNGATNMEELHDKIKKFTYYKSKEEILPYLPKKNYMVYSIDSTKDFDRQNKEIDELMASGDTLKIDQLNKIKELIRSAYYLKRQTTFDSIDELLENGEKVVIVAYHHSVIQDLVDRYKCEYIDGSVDSSKRQGIIDRYEAGAHKTIVLQIQSGGVGFSILTSRTMFFAESWSVPSDIIQVCDRVHRMTSTWPQVDYYMPVVANSVEERMMQDAIDKSKNSSIILTGKSTSLLDSPDRLDPP